MIDENLSWTPHIDFLGKRIRQHIYFLRRLKSFGASSRLVFLLFTSVIRSIMLYCSTACLSDLAVKNKSKLYNQIRVCSIIIGLPVAQAFQEANSMLRLATNISSDSTHVLNNGYLLLPSNRCFRVHSFSCNRLKQ